MNRALPALALLCAAAPAAAGEGDGWRVTLPDALDAEIDAAAAVSLTIAARDGHTVSRDGPILIDLAAEPADALVLGKRRLARRDAADAQADAPRFDLKFKARREGDHRLNVTVRFWVCARRTCRPVRHQAAVTIHARPPAPPPPPSPPP